MTDVRTEIKAINEELQALETQFVEDWLLMPDTLGQGECDRPTDHPLESPPPEDQASVRHMPHSQPSKRSADALKPKIAPSPKPPAQIQISGLANGEQRQPTIQKPIGLPSFQISSPSTAHTPSAKTQSMTKPSKVLGEAIAKPATSQNPISPVQEQDEFESVLDAKLRELDTQAAYVNHLAEQQETALLTLKAIAEAAQFEVIRSGLMDDPTGSTELNWLEDYQQATVSFVEDDGHGRWVIRSRAIDWFRAERDALTTAEQLRRLQKTRSRSTVSSQPSPVSAAPRRQPRLAIAPVSDPEKRSSRRRREQSDASTLVRSWVKGAKRALDHHKAQLEARSPVLVSRLGRLSPLTPNSSPNEQSPAGVQFRIFVLWIAGAAAIRIGLNVLSAIAPSLVPVVILGGLGIGGLLFYRLFTQ
ncbi:MAG: hypothetical protein IGR76_12295 [Synechococcales cyanobacterium T60_A2020_003]|nr:hypothetical protein [Synechococcales cyanobacterium T60_A2020_003]